VPGATFPCSVTPAGCWIARFSATGSPPLTGDEHTRRRDELLRAIQGSRLEEHADDLLAGGSPDHHPTGRPAAPLDPDQPDRVQGERLDPASGSAFHPVASDDHPGRGQEHDRADPPQDRDELLFRLQRWSAGRSALIVRVGRPRAPAPQRRSSTLDGRCVLGTSRRHDPTIGQAIVDPPCGQAFQQGSVRPRPPVGRPCRCVNAADFGRWLIRGDDGWLGRAVEPPVLATRPCRWRDASHPDRAWRSS
jgi:hypothetical protein